MLDFDQPQTAEPFVLSLRAPYAASRFFHRHRRISSILPALYRVAMETADGFKGLQRTRRKPETRHSLRERGYDHTISRTFP